MKMIEVPRLKPVAMDTWEVSGTLLASNAEGTARLPLTFPEPYEIVGIKTTVRQITNLGGRVVPTPDDILVLFDLDLKRNFTAQGKGLTTTAGQRTQYITLSALDTRFRDLQIRMLAPNPDVGFTFRWANFNAALYEDCRVAVSLFVTPLRDTGEGVNP